MNVNYNLDTLSPNRFMERLAERQARVEQASADPLPKDYAVNALARALHPQRQFLKVAAVTELEKDCKCYRLEADPARGTSACAYFAAGQYLTVFLNVDGMPINRAYSISSSPKEALDGFYTLTIKYVEGGLASRYILDTWEVGTPVEVSAPEGTFEYQPLRDAPHVIAVAGGSGITPFLSLAKAIVDGDEEFTMTLLYGSRTVDNILFREEFDRLAAATDKLNVVHVLSHEEREGYEHGFVTAELIQKYAPSGPYSVFLCGPQQMYRFVDGELEKLGLEPKYIRHELFGEFHNPKQEADYPADAPETVKITVTIQGESCTVTGSANDSILQTLEKHEIAVPSRCRSGECGWCHSRLISGKVYIPKALDGRRLADSKYGYVHPCCTFPLSDIEIEVPAAK